MMSLTRRSKTSVDLSRLGEGKRIRDSSLRSRMTQRQNIESEMSASTFRDFFSRFQWVQGSPLPKEA
jgi:hypothetical protein